MVCDVFVCGVCVVCVCVCVSGSQPSSLLDFSKFETNTNSELTYFQFSEFYIHSGKSVTLLHVLKPLLPYGHRSFMRSEHLMHLKVYNAVGTVQFQDLLYCFTLSVHFSVHK